MYASLPRWCDFQERTCTYVERAPSSQGPTSVTPSGGSQGALFHSAETVIGPGLVDRPDTRVGSTFKLAGEDE